MCVYIMVKRSFFNAVMREFKRELRCYNQDRLPTLIFTGVYNDVKLTESQELKHQDTEKRITSSPFSLTGKPRLNQPAPEKTHSR